MKSSLSIVVVFWILTSVAAASDIPSADYIFPAGGQRGTTVQFRVGAHFLHGGAPFEMFGGGLSAGERIERAATTWFEGPMIFKPASQAAENYPKDHAGQVAIQEDARPGYRFWRLWTSQGTIESRPFLVGSLPELVEQEIDGRPLPTRVSLPLTINGRIFPREDVDIWEFQALAGESVTCAVMAAQFGSPLDSRLQLKSPSGRTLKVNTDYEGQDSLLRFVAPEAGLYRLEICDSSFRGGQSFVYRLTISNGGYVDRVFPLGGKVGSRVQLLCQGQGVPDQPISFELPQREPGDYLTALPIGDGLSNLVMLAVDNLKEAIETEPNDDSTPPGDSAEQLPVVLNGQIGRPGDVDCWWVAGRKDQVVQFDLGAARYRSQLDAVLTIRTAEGKVIAEAASTQDKPVEPRLDVTFPADGHYQIQVRDYRPQFGGPGLAYRLKITELSPDFQLRLTSDAATLFRGAETRLKVKVLRDQGFNKPVTLRVLGLPEKVTCPDVTVPGDKNEGELVFRAEGSAEVGLSKLKVTGHQAEAEPKLTRTARFDGPRGAAPRTELALAVSMPTPFKLDGVAFRTSYAARGTVHRRHYRIHRNGYEGPLTLLPADRQIRHQQGVVGKPLHVAPETSEVDYPVFVPTGLEMNRTSRTVVMAVGEVEDEGGRKHKVSYSSSVPADQIIMLTAPAPLSLSTSRRSFAATPGELVSIRLRIARGTLPDAPVEVTVQMPKHIHGVHPQPLVIPAGQDEGELVLQFGEEPGPFNAPLIIRGAMLVNNDPVFAESKIELVRRE